MIPLRELIGKRLYEDSNPMKEMLKKNTKLWIQRFNAMSHPPISAYITQEDVILLHELFTSAEFGQYPKSEKIQVADMVLEKRGFYRYHSGTNRIVYALHGDNSILIKVAVDNIGISDNYSENRNQQYLKPFVPKVYDVTPCGTIEMIERVNPIKSQQEFLNMVDNIFFLLKFIFTDKFIMEDIGTDFFMNWGVRDGFGAVLLDFPYLYVAIPSRLKCVQVSKDGVPCNGDLEYDDGMNTIICSKCHHRYAAKDIGMPIERYIINKSQEDLKVEGGSHMDFDNIVVQFKGRNGKIVTKGPEEESIWSVKSSRLYNKYNRPEKKQFTSKPKKEYHKKESKPPVVEEEKNSSNNGDLIGKAILSAVNNLDSVRIPISSIVGLEKYKNALNSAKNMIDPSVYEMLMHGLKDSLKDIKIDSYPEDVQRKINYLRSVPIHPEDDMYNCKIIEGKKMKTTLVNDLEVFDNQFGWDGLPCNHSDTPYIMEYLNANRERYLLSRDEIDPSTFTMIDDLQNDSNVVMDSEGPLNIVDYIVDSFKTCKPFATIVAHPDIDYVELRKVLKEAVDNINKRKAVNTEDIKKSDNSASDNF